MQILLKIVNKVEMLIVYGGPFNSDKPSWHFLTYHTLLCFLNEYQNWIMRLRVVIVKFSSIVISLKNSQSKTSTFYPLDLFNSFFNIRLLLNNIYNQYDVLFEYSFQREIGVSQSIRFWMDCRGYILSLDKNMLFKNK